MEGGTPRAYQCWCIDMDPWGEMAGGQEVGRGLNNYVYSILTLYGFTLGWFGE